VPFLVVLAGGGLVYWGRRRLPRGGGALSLSPALLLVLAVTLPLGLSLFLEGLKTGLLTFGGAYSAVPLLQQSAVEGHGWLTQDEFVDGLAIGGVLPAPMIIFATFVGYLAGGVGGAVLITVGVFLPAFVFPLFLHRQLVAASGDERLRPFLLGVTAAVVGMIAAVAVDLLGTSVPDWPAALLALGAFAALYRWSGKLTVLWVVLGCGAIGALLQLTVL
jgi:chromate transporter